MPTLRFLSRGLNCEIAKLGDISVAEIVPLGEGGRGTWFIHLPGIARKSGPAGSFEAGRRKIVHEVEEWRARAGETDRVFVEIGGGT